MSRAETSATEKPPAAGLARRVMVVGNAPVSVDYSEMVDGSEHVIRMNGCPNWGKNTGTRTTILGLINNGVTGRDHYKKQSLRGWPVAEKACEVWFRAHRYGAWDVLKTILRHPRSRKQYLDYGEKLVRAHGLENKRIVYADRSLIPAARKRLWELDRGRPWKKVLPTSGYLIIERVLADPRFKDCEVCLLGFNWEVGSSKRPFRAGHTWDEEETLVRQYAEQGRVKILPCEAQ